MATSLNPYAPPSADEVFAVEEHSFKPAGALTTALSWMLGMSIVANAISIVSTAAQIELLERLQGGGAWTLPEVAANNLRVSAVAGVELLILLATAIVWFVWQSRTSKNARALGAEDMEFGPHAWGWYFCPILNLWRPLQVIRELWRVSSPDDGQAAQSAGDYRPCTAPSWFLAWWLPWLAAAMFDQISTLVIRNTDLPILGSQYAQVSSVMMIIAGVFAIKLVGSISQRERARVAVHGAQS